MITYFNLIAKMNLKQQPTSPMSFLSGGSGTPGGGRALANTSGNVSKKSGTNMASPKNNNNNTSSHKKQSPKSRQMMQHNGFRQQHIKTGTGAPGTPSNNSRSNNQRQRRQYNQQISSHQQRQKKTLRNNVVTENQSNNQDHSADGVAETEMDTSVNDNEAGSRVNKNHNIRFELGKFRQQNGALQNAIHVNKTMMRHSTNEDDTHSYGRQSYDDEQEQYQRRGDFGLNTNSYEHVRNNSLIEQQKIRFNLAIQDKLQRDREAASHRNPYQKRCMTHLVFDDPDDLNCTFKPMLMRPLGAPKTGPADPLMFKPVKTIEHSPITKSSMDYHCKRLNQARNGPQQYRSKPPVQGGGPFYQKIACEGTQRDPVKKSQVKQRRDLLQEHQRITYNKGIKGNDPRFNLVGGTFKGAIAVPTSLATMDLPEQSLDRKRLRQKTLQGQNFDQKFLLSETQQSTMQGNAALYSGHERSKTIDQSFLSNVSSAKVIQTGRTHRDEFQSNNVNDQLRRSIQPYNRNQPLSHLLGRISNSHYSKVTIADRFANRGIRNKNHANTLPVSMLQSPRSPAVVDSEDSKILIRSALNQKSQASDIFGAALVKGKIENAGYSNDFIRGVPKFIDSTSKGLRYATRDDFFDNSLQTSAQQSSYYNNNINFNDNTYNYETTHEHDFQNSNSYNYQKAPLANKFQENWYPEGIDMHRQTFLKRSLKNHENQPHHRTFDIALDPSEMLIPQLFTQSNDIKQRKKTRQVTSDLTKFVKECQFNVLEQDYDKFGIEQSNKNIKATDAFNNTKDKDDQGIETDALFPSVCFSPGLKKSGVFYKVVSNKKREPLPQRKEEEKKRKESQGSQASIEFLNGKEGGAGKKDGADALNVDHGFYDFVSVPQFHRDRFQEVYQTYKQLMTKEAEKAQEQANGGELASEQMAELAQEMLESDPKTETMTTQTNQPVPAVQDQDTAILSMNNLHLLQYQDFMVLHNMYPKIFMLAMDNQKQQELTKQASKGKIVDKNSQQIENNEQNKRDRISNQEQISLQKAQLRSMNTFKARKSNVQSNNLETKLQASETLQNRHQKIFNNNDPLAMMKQHTMPIVTTGAANISSTGQSPKHMILEATRVEESPSLITSQESSNMKNNQTKDAHIERQFSIQPSSMGQQAVTFSDHENAKALQNSRQYQQQVGVNVDKLTTPQHLKEQNRSFTNTNSSQIWQLQQRQQQQQPIRVQDAQQNANNSPSHSMFQAGSFGSQVTGVVAGGARMQGSQYGRQTTVGNGNGNGDKTNTSQTAANRSVSNRTGAKTNNNSVKMSRQLTLTSYEVCVQKYTMYMRSKKFQRCEVLMKQGKQIFRREECSQQFSFNKGALFIAQQMYDEAIESYLALYEGPCKEIHIRPSAYRIEGTNMREDFKFAILNNLIIAYIMREQAEPDRTSQQELYQILRAEKLFDVRYTQSEQELNLFKMAIYFKQYLKAYQVKRFMENLSSSSKDNNMQDGDANDTNQIDETQNEGDVTERSEYTVNSQIDREFQESDSTYEQQPELKFETFVKNSPSKDKRNLAQPLHSVERKFDFLSRHTPIYSVPSLPSNVEKDSKSNVANRIKAAKTQKLFEELKEQKKIKDEAAKLTKLGKKVQQVITKVTKNSSANYPEKMLNQTRNDTGRDLNSYHSGDPSSQHKMPLSEADSIFDEMHPLHQNLGSPVGKNEFTLKVKDQQNEGLKLEKVQEISSQMVSHFQTVTDEQEQTSEEYQSQETEEARELGIDLSALYSHKKPKTIDNSSKWQWTVEEVKYRHPSKHPSLNKDPKNAQAGEAASLKLVAGQKMVDDIVRIQQENKMREQNYKQMDINRIERRKKLSGYQASFDQNIQKIQESMMKMQIVEVEMIRDGGGVKKLDPLQTQYQALATSIKLLCEEPDIDNIIVDYLKGQNEICEARRSGKKQEKSKSTQISYSAALEVLTHAVSHILNAEQVNIKESDRQFLIQRIHQVKTMFEDELVKPDKKDKRESGLQQTTPALNENNSNLDFDSEK